MLVAKKNENGGMLPRTASRRLMKALAARSRIIVSNESMAETLGIADIIIEKRHGAMRKRIRMAVTLRRGEQAASNKGAA